MFICTSRHVYALRDVIIPRLSINVLSFPTVAYKALGLKSRKENLKALLFFEECFQSVCLETLNLDIFFKLFNGLKYPAV